MNFEKFQNLVEKRPYYGELENPTVVSEYKNVGCGDGYRLYLEIKDNKIENISYTTTGCSFSLASLSILCDLVKGKTLTEAQAVDPDMMDSYIDGYPERRKNYRDTAISALKKAISDYQNNTGLDLKTLKTKKSILAILKEKGSLAQENLASASLDRMNLDGVDFSYANLNHAFFSGSSLKNANFSHANLKGAFLNDCDLTGANFTGADLRFAKLTGSKLDEAIFENAIYDIGTRVDPKYISIFQKMEQKGKELYVKATVS